MPPTKVMLVLGMFFLGIVVDASAKDASAAATFPPCGKQVVLDILATQRIPSTIDVTLIKEVSTPSQSEQGVRRLVESIYDHSETGAVHAREMDSASREAEMKAEIQNILQQQGEPRIIEQRIRAKGHLYRVDQTVFGSGFVADANRPYAMTYVNSGAMTQGDYTHFRLDHEEQTATVWDSRPMWGRTPVEDLGKIPAQLTYLLLQNLNEDCGESPSANADTECSDAPCPPLLCTSEETGTDKKRVDIRVAAAGSGKNQIDIAFPALAGAARWRLTCDAQNPAQIGMCESRDAGTGSIIWTRECLDFDEGGFPRNVTERFFDGEGSLLREERMAIVDVKTDLELDSGLFAFRVPLGFYLVDRRVEPPLVMQKIPAEAFEIPFDEFEEIMDPLD